MNKLRLLVITQAVDLDDPVLGFFHGWLTKFATYGDVEAVCLRAGRYELPHNVRVHSLGKERGGNRLLFALRFYARVWRLRHSYDAVFVHMNQEYVLLAGLLWRLTGKRVVLWRNHKVGSWRTRLACALAHAVCYTSPSAYVAAFKNALRMPIGVDTDLFRQRGTPQEAILFLGRFDAVKKPDVFLESIARLREQGITVSVHVVGDATRGREAVAEGLKHRFSSLTNVDFLPAVRNTEAAGLFASHALYVNLTPSGSFDKTIGEAAASGCIVVVANEALRGVVPDRLIVDADSPVSVALGIQTALSLDHPSREHLRARLRDFVVTHHSLQRLFEKIIPVLSV